MMFDHEKLDVHRCALEFAAWSRSLCKSLPGSDRSLRDQLLRASQSIALNVSEGNGKRPGADRRRFLEIAKGSGLECSAVLDLLVIYQELTFDDALPGKDMLLRIVKMLAKMMKAGPR